MKTERQKIALISVYSKEGIVDFAKSLVDLGWKIISSGGTAKVLKDAGLPIIELSEVTGMPPILDHRVLTLHPKIHGGLLALDKPEHLAELEKYGISWIDLVCSDLYPLEEEVENPNATTDSVIEKTDMGGVALIRSSAKGRRITICKTSQRGKVVNWLKDGEPNKEIFLNDLAAEADFLVAHYSATSAWYHSKGKYKSIFGEIISECAYGENAYQKPSILYSVDVGRLQDTLAVHNWQLIAGSPMSYNNICDLDRMMQTMTHIGAGFEKNFGEIPAIAIGVKHGNACGVGVAEEGLPQIAIDKMLLGDLRAIFGGSVMLNFPVDEKIADELMHKFAGEGRRLLDIVAAPSFTPEAVEILSRKKGKCRLLINPAILKAGLFSLDTAKRFRYVRGGFLTQPNYTFVPDMSKCLSDTKIIQDIVLAWAVGCTSNSNTTTLVKDGRLYGNGVGQQDRVGAAKLAIFRADDAAVFANNLGAKLPSGSRAPKFADLEGAVAYSDSFFPFPDAPEVLIDRGIKTIFSTSGSINDEKIIELCKSKGVDLILIPDTEGRGFYQH
jgi:phosphoribosylaminoimidazolecarboxamide formyltransferase/IMP cyclohydrolase